MAKILITGANGQLGMELQKVAEQNTKYIVLATDTNDLDITDPSQVTLFFEKHQPQYCINCAAYTQVDQAELEKEKAYLINEIGSHNLAIACDNYRATLLHISTDFVFGGGQYSMPLREDSYTQPVNVYGNSKLAGELAVKQQCPQHIILRTSWLYSSFGNNFVKTMRRLGREKESISVVNDQIGSPTYAYDLAISIFAIISSIENTPANKLSQYYGLYHYSNEGVASWYDFAKAIFELSNITINVEPILSQDYPTPAIRPQYSVMDKSKIKQVFDLPITHWRDSLKNCIQILNTNT